MRARRGPTPALAVLGAFVMLAGAACGSDDDLRGRSDPTTTSTPEAADAPRSTSSTPTPGDGTDVTARLVAEFDQPVMVVPVPGATPGTRHYVVERSGTIRFLDGSTPGGVALDVSAQISSGGERGLLGLAVATVDGSPHGFVDYTNSSGDTRVVEYTIGADGVFDPASARERLAVAQPFANHNGGHLAIGPDGFLYVGLGDGGSGGDPEQRAQDLDTLLGKIVRLDPARPDAAPEIWAYGLRNPWRFSFDRDTGRLWIGDVGQNRFEEIDRAPEGSTGGENYGWDRYEGTARFEGDPLPDDQRVDPIYVYGRGNGNCSVTGGHVYRGSKVPGLRGRYVFGDYCRGELLSFVADASTVDDGDVTALGIQIPQLSSFADDGTGELFAMSLDGGVYRLEAVSP